MRYYAAQTSEVGRRRLFVQTKNRLNMYDDDGGHDFF
jgi:hypothetical protein